MSTTYAGEHTTLIPFDFVYHICVRVSYAPTRLTGIKRDGNTLASEIWQYGTEQLVSN